MFKPYIKDETITSPGSVEKVILCCGKVFYDLKYERAKRKLDTKVAICRIEQVFPFPYSDLRKDMSQYPKAQVLWAQEEHKNQGWWDFVKTRVAAVVDRHVEYRGRAPSPAPSSGTKVMHDKEQVTFLEKCFS
uniref:2-oxoglutarate dehydrogenase E1 component/KDG C-terminal domain-containing protein n=2 Tax=Homalodisca liturata TaxID=320908 RepID=A0A1B6HE37_9HEMI